MTRNAPSGSVFRNSARPTAILKAKQPRLIGVHDLRDWIQREVLLSLAEAPFDVNDADLLPAAGACSTCPKRSGNNSLLFSDLVRRKDVCTDRECFHAKVRAQIELRFREAETAGEKPIRVSDSHLFYGQKPRAGVIYRSDYREAKAAGECPTTTAAIVVDGNATGRKLYVCAAMKCPVHVPRSPGLSPEEKAQRKKQREPLRIQQEYRKRLLEAVYQKVPSALTRHELGLVALRYFEQLGHDSQQRLFKFFGWEVKKANGNPGGYTDYPKLASAKLESLTAAELGRFLVVCALASDLYCPSYVSGAALPKDSRLARGSRTLSG